MPITKKDYNSSEVADIIENEEFVTHNIRIKNKNTIIIDGRINIYLNGKCYTGCTDYLVLNTK
jgi:hypothetical protein